MDIPPFDHPDLRRSLAGLESGADDFLARQGYFRENGIYRTSSENRRRIALFCHNGSGLALLALLLRIPLPSIWSGFFFRTSSVTTVLFEERASGIATVRCIGLGDLSHLRLAGLDPGESGLKANVE